MPLELIIGAAVGAGLASESGRKTIRKGLVYGLAGVLMGYDKVAAFAAEVRGARKGTAEPSITSAPPNTAATSEPAAPPGAARPSPDPVMPHTDQTADCVTSR